MQRERNRGTWTLSRILAIIGILVGEVDNHASAQPRAHPDYRRFAHESTLIVKGKIGKTQGLNLVNGKDLGEVITSIQAQSVLKGRLAQPSIQVRYVEGRSTDASVPHQYTLAGVDCALLFLRNDPSGGYVFADSETGYIPITCQPLQPAETEPNILDKIELYLFASMSDREHWKAQRALSNRSKM